MMVLRAGSASNIYAVVKYTCIQIPDRCFAMSLLSLPVSLHACLLSGAIALASGAAWAEKADRAKPMNAESDSLRYDDAKQTSVFTGNVVITKGTLVLRADRVEVRQDNEGFQFGTATSTGGKRAFFRQKREGGDEWIEGEAESIVYDGRADSVTFRGNAVLKRLRGATVADETQGALITYDNTSDVFSVSGGNASSAGNPSGRVRAVLTPRSAAPAAQSGTPGGAPLRQSTDLGGAKK